MQQLIESGFKQLRQLLTDIPAKNRFLWLESALIERFSYHFMETMREMQVMKLETVAFGKIPNDECNIIIVARNTEIAAISANVRKLQAQNSQAQFHLYMLPRLFENNDQLLRDLKTMDFITAYEPIPIHFFSTYDSDVFELFQKTQIFQGSLQTVSIYADLLIHIQQSIGGARVITGKGQLGTQVVKQYERLLEERDIKQTQSYYEQVVVIDRMVDMVSFLLTGQNYAEQLATHLGFKNNKLDTDFIYSSFDEVFEALMHTSMLHLPDQVDQFLKSAKEKEQDMKKLQESKSKNVQAMKAAAEKMQQAIKIKESVAKHAARAKQLLQARSFQVAEHYFLQKDILRDKAKFDQLNDLLLNHVISQAEAFQLVLLYALFVNFKAKEIPIIKKTLVNLYGASAELALAMFTDLNYFTPSKQFTDMIKFFQVLELEDKPDKTKIQNCYQLINCLSVKVVENALGLLEKKTKDQIQTYEFKTELKPDMNRVLVVYVGPMTHAEAAGLELLRKNFDELQVICSQVVDGQGLVKAALAGEI
ncbi:Sec1_family protein [Hexamita inflata]|uniref:Sec1 family protein n=1 Tax=Hexamita inflata TaxID=28002 RepID=A0AA86RBH9_9EUKA|nr:Sec1 family protein [Hexamita inflata]